jgi:hypothetical protein
MHCSLGFADRSHLTSWNRDLGHGDFRSTVGLRDGYRPDVQTASTNSSQLVRCTVYVHILGSTVHEYFEGDVELHLSYVPMYETWSVTYAQDRKEEHHHLELEQGDRSFGGPHHERDDARVKIGPIEIQDGSAEANCL